ncbi:hypothetical protein COR50_01140 [Chitinophaga caeni]|uniref:DUF4252 domain-containing protein n=1 Tax=Chitinophaga caeni TaxID=2029983 RepID=A0A291QPL6_9BACT|nr:hypothetical protein [Chitinophaga caeni]ATL45876.1 hypothetical protein COR50_01140 [Chitinophaga caeni]
MKRILFIIFALLPLYSLAQKLDTKVADAFSERIAYYYPVKNDAIMIFINEQMARSGAGGLDMDKTMTDLKSDATAMDAALKYLYQYSDCNRQTLIANLRAMQLPNNSVYTLATYVEKKYKDDSKALLDEKEELLKSGVLTNTNAAKEPEAPRTAAVPVDVPATTTPVAKNKDSIDTKPVMQAETYDLDDKTDWNLGNVFKLNSARDLVAKYGKENIVLRDAYDLSGNFIGQAYVVFPDTNNELEMLFDNDSSKTVIFSQVRSKWKTPFSIRVGDPLSKLVKMNGRDFKFNGFDWQDGGIVYSWEGGNLDHKGIKILLKANNSGDTKLYNKVSGGQKVSSDHSALKGLDVVIDKIAFHTGGNE